MEPIEAWARPTDKHRRNRARCPSTGERVKSHPIGKRVHQARTCPSPSRSDGAGFGFGAGGSSRVIAELLTAGVGMTGNLGRLLGLWWR